MNYCHPRPVEDLFLEVFPFYHDLDPPPQAFLSRFQCEDLTKYLKRVPTYLPSRYKFIPNRPPKPFSDLSPLLTQINCAYLPLWVKQEKSLFEYFLQNGLAYTRSFPFFRFFLFPSLIPQVQYVDFETPLLSTNCRFAFLFFSCFSPQDCRAPHYAFWRNRILFSCSGSPFFSQRRRWRAR